MTLQTPQPGVRVGEFFWIKWVLANTMGFAVGAAASSALHQAIVRPLVGAASGGVVAVISGILSWVYAIFVAVAIGAAQWFFLRRRVGWANSWFLATSLGWLASEFVAQSLAARLVTGALSPVSGAAIGVVPAVLVALPQWLILRRHVLRAGWWVAASIAGAAGGFVGYLAGYFGSIVVVWVITESVGEAWGMAVYAGLASATVGAAISAITGVALMRLLKRPIPDTPLPPASMILED